MAVQRNSKDLLAKFVVTTPPIPLPLPPFPKVPLEIKNANPKLTEAWERWDAQIAEWIKQQQV